LRSVKILDSIPADVRDVNDIEEGRGNFNTHFEDTKVLMYLNIDDRGKP